MKNMRKLKFEIKTTATVETYNTMYINYEFFALSNADDSEVESICIEYIVGIDASSIEVILQLYHLMSDIVASEELYATEKLQAVELVETEIKRLTNLLRVNQLYKVTFDDKVGIVSALDVRDCLQGNLLGNNFHEIPHAEVRVDNLRSVEQVSLYEVCKTILNI